MRFITYGSAVIFAVLGLLVTATSAQAARFSDKQIKDHPCLEKTAFPWVVSPAKIADIPEVYKAWGNLWSGYWNNTACHTLVIKKITPDGKVDLIYSTGGGEPQEFGYGELTGTILFNGSNQELRVTTNGGNEVVYLLLVDPSPLLQGIFAGRSRGTFTPVLSDN